MNLSHDRAVVLLSGGQDSTTCLALAIKEMGAENITALAFDYGQRHRIELESAHAITEACGVKLVVIQAPGLRGSSLTDHDRELVAGGHGDLPATFVPGRNLVFLALALGVAVEREAGVIVTGICQTDYSGYPDCREAFRRSAQDALSHAVDAEVRILAPLMWLTKAESVTLAVDAGALPLLALSHTCYQGMSPACGACPACRIRLRGFQEAGVEDPILYR